MQRRSHGPTVTGGLCAAVAMALLAACGGSSGSSTTDAGGNGGSLVTQLAACGEGCSEYVVDAIEIPSSQNLADVSYDFDGDGKVDNALGKIAGMVASYYPSFDAKAELAKGLNEGSAIVLLRTVTSAAGDAAARAWVSKEDCCTSSDAATCANEARATCFSGTHAFVSGSESRDLTGRFTGGALSLGPGEMYFNVRFFGDVPETWTVKAARLQATVTSSGLVEGRLFGAISQDDLSRGLITGIAAKITETLQDPDTSSSTKAALAALFDPDSSGTVDVTEVRNSVLKNVLAGDVDIDGDGVKELTVGLGFTAVRAKINPPSATTK